MTLNRRLLIGIAPVLVIFLGLGLYAIFLFTKLGSAIDVILRENYQSVVAAQNMKEAAEKMNTGLLLRLNGQEAAGQALFHQFDPVFEQYSEVEAHNITLPGEGDLEAAIKRLHGDYLAAAAKFDSLNSADPARRALYFGQLLPISEEVEKTADRILEVNQQNMLEADRAARQQSRDASNYLLLTLLGGFAVAAAAAYALARSILQPIQSLTDSARQLGEGKLDQHVPVHSQDELGLLAATFNKMSARLRAYRQSTTETILQAQQTTESALRAFPDPIVVLSPEEKIELQNSAAERFFTQLGGGFELLEPLGRYVKQSLAGSPDFQPTSFDKALLVNLEGSERFFLPRVLAMRDEAGSITGVIVALQDVTRFRVADDMKTDLIATVSHELKTPLTSMQMAVYLLLEEKVGPLNPKQTELMLAARNNSDRLLEMIEDLLDLARFEGGAALIEKQAIPSEQLVEEEARRSGELVSSRGLELQVEIEPHLPRVEISHARIDQVFANFISNAVRHSPPRGTITLAARRDGAKSVRFSVRDEGPGIPRDLQRRVFDKFFRGSETSGEGAGLGLSIAREIVLAHGGNIGVESSEARGSEFFFTLPALL